MLAKGKFHNVSIFSVYRMEVSQETEERFLFPSFEKLHWYAADVILGRLTSKFSFYPLLECILVERFIGTQMHCLIV